MISINLIPDVKLDMLRAQKMRNVAISFSILIGIGAGVVVAIMASIIGAQIALESVTNGKINSEYSTLSKVNGISNTLTLQHQLTQISGINASKTLDSRLLDVIAAINPASPNNMQFTKVTLDPSSSTLTIEGSASGGYAATEVFRKTILNTTVDGKVGGSSDITSVPLTSDVTLQNTSFGKDSTGTSVLTFTVSFVYPDNLFTNTLSQATVTTPTSKIDVTDSKTRVPDSLFTQAATSGGGN